MKKIKDYSTIRSRGWTIILYPDSDIYNFDDVMFLVRSYKNYCFIKHEPDDEIKKIHYHINIFLDNACFRKSISNKLGVPENYIESIDSVRAMNRYLTHIDFPERIQYDVNLVQVSRYYQKNFKKCFDDLESEFEIINKIYFKIKDLSIEYNSYSDIVRELVLWVSDNVYDNVYKRYRFEFLDYIKNLL